MFNKNARTKNALKLSTINTACYAIIAIAGVFYRMFFVRYLAVSYLGINGLFSNILQLLSLADLGIIDCINFRFYEPIHNSDVKRVGQLLNYMKKIYRLVAAVVFIVGLAVLPFIAFLIKDTSEIPADINIYLVYLLFLLNSVASYCFSYSYSLLSADQQGYKRSIYGTLVSVTGYVVRLLIIGYTGRFTLAIASTIVLTIFFNYIMHCYIANAYKEVFAVRDQLEQSEKKNILSDAGKVLMHRLGGMIQDSTDNILITLFSGVSICGLFSNYVVIINACRNIASKLLVSVSSSIGNAYASMDEKGFFEIYRRLHFIDYYVSGLFATCAFALASDFVTIWLGNGFLLDDLTVFCMCVSFYIICSRFCNWSFINVTGLIAMDVIRPVLSVSMNLIASIVLGKALGIAGVMIGTIISNICAVLWREVRLLYREIFISENITAYWAKYVTNFVITIICMFVSKRLLGMLFTSCESLLVWLCEGILCSVVFTLIFVLCNYRESINAFDYIKNIRKK